jgi:hypothetical protein
MSFPDLIGESSFYLNLLDPPVKPEDDKHAEVVMQRVYTTS